jgi:SAM-dependent methyltransferase
VGTAAASATGRTGSQGETAWPTWACPAHALELATGEESLACPEGHTIPVVAGIPRFVSEEGYSGSFGSQWRRYRQTQLDSYTGTTISADRARRCLGPDLWHNLEEQQVLECGCGAGRFTEVLLDRGAIVTSIDMTDAVVANDQNFGQGPRHRIAQADVLHLPFLPRQFDVVFCLGVLQHTPYPEQTIAMLYEHVAPGGYLVIDHYSYRLAWFLSLNPVWRRGLRRLPPARGLEWTDRIVKTLYPLHHRLRRGRMFLNRISPVITYHSHYPLLAEQHQREWALLDTHDSMTDWYKWFRTRGQIQAVLEKLGLEEIWCEKGGNGVEARGRRPVPAA